MSNIKYLEVEFPGLQSVDFEFSGLEMGPLELPEGMSFEGDLILFGENAKYLHCVISGSGAYYGVFKSEDEDHMYRHLLLINTRA
jgi:hypothetical protein